ncbi:hypothetical protein AF72_13310 [Xylella taiwanensis]|uniref:Uncharacterized protein n=1 Tax=Xylella taiwanensis TaxID=1444770 RepID=Z9JG33_9GAMM|nr:hypothetical protein AF72_13310 [Xylella taiwanensis]
MTQIGIDIGDQNVVSLGVLDCYKYVGTATHTYFDLYNIVIVFSKFLGDL